LASKRKNFRVGFWLGDASLEHGGIGPYALRVLTSLLTESEQGWQIVILCAGEAPQKLLQLIANSKQGAEVRTIPSSPLLNKSSHQTQSRRFGSLFLRARFKTRAPGDEPGRYLEEWLRGLELDLLHFPTQTILHPDLQVPYSLTMYEVLELPHADVPAPFIVTMHDVQDLHFPGYFSPGQRAIRAVQYWKALEKARKVIVSFDHVKADLLKYFGLPEEKIHVCPIPYRAISLQSPTPAAAQAYTEKYAAWNLFLLYPAHTWEHKNHLQLLRALKEVRRQHTSQLKLICTGGTRHHYHAQVVRQVEELGLEDAVLFAGLLPEDELQWLYQHTALVTIPTKYEAGSFPLFEAMFEGVPVICSNVTSLPETILDQRFIFDPHDVQALSELIFRMITDEQLRQDNIANSAAQADRLRGINAAAYFYETYRSILQGTKG
jgi:glycosyltransferase involved in cell wall biosynthesis